MTHFPIPRSFTCTSLYNYVSKTIPISTSQTHVTSYFSSIFLTNPLISLCFFAFTLYLLLRKLILYLTIRNFRDGPYVIGYHQWRPHNVAGPHYCNLCDALVYGIRSIVVTCDICGMYAHAQCAVSVSKYKIPLAVIRAQNDALQRKYSCGSLSESLTQADSIIIDDDLQGIAAQCCKMAAVDACMKNYVHRHFWIKGNIDPMDKCSVCNLICGSMLALTGLKCAYCHMRVHEKCFRMEMPRHRFLRRCDFGIHRNLILPPFSIIAHTSPSRSSKSQNAMSKVRKAAQRAVNKMSSIRLGRSSSQSLMQAIETERGDSCVDKRKTEADAVVERDDFASVSAKVEAPYEIDPPLDVTPLLVFINSKSGGKLGLHVLRQIRKYLNPLQIYDLTHQSPEEPLYMFKDVARLRILVCGGDGTVGWILNTLDTVIPNRQLPVAILPLGTGNDLARTLGWGSGFSTRSIGDVLMQVENAHVSLLDRWCVSINGSQRTVLNNYFGIGVDAQVALEFHEQRERAPGLFMSQFVNKLWYSQLGAKNFLVRTCSKLCEKLDLICDGVTIQLPGGTEGVIILNINSYGGGAKLWQEDSDDEREDAEISDDETDDGVLSECSSETERKQLKASLPHDGLLDVVAVYGTFHLGQMQVGLSRAVRLCQCKTVEVCVKETLPLQIDGEPWQQQPCTVKISFHQQAFMLSRTVQERDFVTRKVGEVLDWAENTQVIDSKQRDVLLAQIARHIADAPLGAISMENGFES